ncbi:MAG: nucleoside 2-deoxyribosyltransferase [Clostridia bacterium]|nr:nucleoside 2-deoxyribosyltransferase [Clostridia bacterium]
MKIYMSGSIYGGREKIETYKKIIKELEKYAEVINKNIADDNVLEKEAMQNDEDIFLDLENKLKSADLIFAEVTIPSLGAGYELGFADMLRKRIIGIYDKTITPKVSTMIRGNKRITLIPYEDISEIIERLEEILEI